MDRPRPLVLCILDGYGEREARDANAVVLANAPRLRAIREGYPMTLIGASGADVGLPDKQMGNSEVGHLNFGAGRVAMMDLSRIDQAIAKHEMGSNPVLVDLLERIRPEPFRHSDLEMPDDPLDHFGSDTTPNRLHLIGLVSNGGVHSSLEHLFSLLDTIGGYEIPIVVHAILDGRDTPPKSAIGFVRELENRLAGRGIIGTVGGRYYGMDRDRRWDRVAKHFKAIVHGECDSYDDAESVIEAAYAAGITDEFVEPVRIGDYEGMKGEFEGEFGSGKPPVWEWRTTESAFCFNFRPDRMRQLCAMLLGKNLPPEAAALACEYGRPVVPFRVDGIGAMTEYDPSLGMKVAFRKDEIDASFGEVISRAGLKQFRCAETEKYAHVTYFFNGGHEAAFEGEERKVIPSPRDVPTYDKKPEMSAAAVGDAVTEAIESDAYDFVLVNFANPDMVGHTGVLDAARQAVEAVDAALGKIEDAVRAKGGALIVTADHGNCETMADAEGNPHTAHTTNPVPFYYVNDHDREVGLRKGGRLSDVAPTMLEILGLESPPQMTGKTLRVAKN